MGKVIQFPTVKEGEELRKQMTELESEIKLRLDELQVINEEVIQLTVKHDLFYTLISLTI